MAGIMQDVDELKKRDYFSKREKDEQEARQKQAQVEEEEKQ